MLNERWRLEMAEALAARLEPKRFGVHALYLIGSAKSATAGPGSDVDLIVHHTGTARQRDDLLLWLDGWSHCLDELHYLKNGRRTGGLLDVHFVTDEDIEKQTSFAVKIGAVSDGARKLQMKGPNP